MASPGASPPPAPAEQRRALYQQDGRWFHPSDLTRSPWGQDAQHAGASCALLALLFERSLTLPLARLSFSFLRPIPLEPLEATVSVLKGGVRSQLANAKLENERGLVCTAEAQALRRDKAIAPEVLPELAPLPPPERCTLAERPSDAGTMFSWDGAEVRFARGGYVEPGPASAWLRLRQPVLGSEPPSGVQRAVAACDFGNGLSSALPWDAYLFVNTDLSVQLLREPRGEWIGLDSTTTLSGGVGIAHSGVRDQDGPLGQAAQTLFIDRRRRRIP
jgi:hypothetical protein